MKTHGILEIISGISIIIESFFIFSLSFDSSMKSILIITLIGSGIFSIGCGCSLLKDANRVSCLEHKVSALDRQIYNLSLDQREMIVRENVKAIENNKKLKEEKVKLNVENNKVLYAQNYNIDSETIKCGNCGFVQPADRKVCWKCGVKFIDANNLITIDYNDEMFSNGKINVNGAYYHMNYIDDISINGNKLYIDIRGKIYEIRFDSEEEAKLLMSTITKK